MATGLVLSTLLALVLSSDTPDDEVTTLHERSVQIPIHVDPEKQDSIAELRLFVSADEGKTWRKVAVARPGQESFHFIAPWNGTFWFTLQAVMKNKDREPKDLKNAPPGQKMLVKAPEPLKPAQRQALHGTAVFPAASLSLDLGLNPQFFEEYRSDKETNALDLTKAGCGRGTLLPPGTSLRGK